MWSWASISSVPAESKGEGDSVKKLLVIASILCCASGTEDAAERIIRAEVILDAPLSEVWKAWTTEEGARKFFAPDCRIDLRVDGAYEMYFNPGAEPGRRGGEGLRILLLEPMRRLSFTWNAPPENPYVRNQRTVVVIEYQPLGPRRTHLRLTHSGWGVGPEWDAAYEYFNRAWKGTVLPRLQYSLTEAPVNWDNPPPLRPVIDTVRVEPT